jgi:hypothetical protein
VDVINLTKLILEYASDKIWMIDSEDFGFGYFIWILVEVHCF